jgi:hypothetical protein
MLLFDLQQQKDPAVVFARCCLAHLLRPNRGDRERSVAHLAGKASQRPHCFGMLLMCEHADRESPAHDLRSGESAEISEPLQMTTLFRCQGEHLAGYVCNVCCVCCRATI